MSGARPRSRTTSSSRRSRISTASGSPSGVVHARGAGAHGWFEAYGKIGDEPASKYTRARVLNETGVKTPMFVRFSTVAGAKESPETERDPRGFAVKFKTVDGNWDLVGNNLKVFFIRDAIKFPDMIHAFEPDPVTNRQEAWRFFDFVAQHPESIHMVTHLKSPWGILANYREMEGSGVNTYKLVNDQGEAVLCKFHWIPKQGVRNLTSQQASEIQAKDVGHATRDLYDNIKAGNFPEWEFAVQIMPDGPNDHLSFDPGWTTRSCGRSTSSRCCPAAGWSSTGCRTTSSPRSSSRPSGPACWSTASTSRTTRCSRAGRCPTRHTQRYRVGANYLQLPINAPQPGVKVYSNQRDGQMAYTVDGTGPNKHINYEPSTLAEGLREAPKPAKDYHQPVQGNLGRYQTSRTEDDYTQAGVRYRSFADWERDDLIANLVADMKQCPEPIQLRMVWHFWHADEDYGRRVAEGAGIDLEKAKALPPLPGRAAPGKRLQSETYTDGSQAHRVAAE